MLSIKNLLEIGSSFWMGKFKLTMSFREGKKNTAFFPPVFLRELLISPCWRAGSDILHQDNKDVRDATIKTACSCKTLKSLPNKALLKFSRYILWGFNICQVKELGKAFPCCSFPWQRMPAITWSQNWEAGDWLCCSPCAVTEASAQTLNRRRKRQPPVSQRRKEANIQAKCS